MMGFGRFNLKPSDAGPEVEGQGLVEYALIICLVVLVAFGALVLAADAIVALWTQIREVLVPVFGG
jgi:Flp pilus assembly pilin Flp